MTAANCVNRKSLQIDGDIFSSAKPYPHCKFFSFLECDFAKKVASDFDYVDWQHAVHVNENKYWNKTPQLPAHLTECISYLNSDSFLKYLSGLTGINNLVADPELRSGGVHRTGRNGFLNIHADFTVHPNLPNLQRRLNLLIYLTPNWLAEWGGELELWDTDMTERRVSYTPEFNTAILFATDANSFHGCPSPLQTPPEVYRHSIALYYYTEHDGNFPSIATNYRAMPTDSLLKKLAIRADSWLVSIFHKLKREIGISDRFFTALFDRKQK